MDVRAIMVPRSNFDPNGAAAILEALAEALRHDPRTPGALELVPGFVAAVEAAREWAAEHGIPTACIPAEFPAGRETDPDATAGFAEMPAATDSGRLYDLGELEQLTAEMLANLTLVSEDARMLDYELMRARGDGLERDQAIESARGRAGRLWLYSELVAEALREVHAGLKAFRLNRLNL